MNNKGFTLIEIMLAITILTMILLLAIPKLTGLLGNNRIEAKAKIDKSIISAAINYVIDNNIEDDANIPLSELCKGYIDCPITNPLNDEILDVCVIKSKVNDLDNYEVSEDTSLCS